MIGMTERGTLTFTNLSNTGLEQPLLRKLVNQLAALNDLNLVVKISAQLSY